MSPLEQAAISYVQSRDRYVQAYDRSLLRPLLDASYLELKLAVIAVGECSTENGAA